MFMKHADGCSEHNKYQMKWVVLFLSMLTLILVCPPFAAITAAHLSGIVSIYFLRTSTLMLSHVFCNSSYMLSFECTIDLSSLFSNSPQICSMGLRSRLWGGSPSFSVLLENKSRPNKTTSIFTKSPAVPDAEMAPHIIIIHPMCLTVGKRYSFLYLSPSLRRTYTLHLLPNCSNLDSSVHNNLFQFSFVHFLCSFANFRHFTLFFFK